MKNVLTALVLLAVSSTLVAQELSKEQLQVRSMIKEVKETPVGERYQKMNQFKKQIGLMSAQAQKEAFKELNIALQTQEQLQTQTRTQERINEGNGQGTQEHVRTQSHLQLQEAQQHLKLQSQIQNQNRVQKMGAGSPSTRMGHGK